MNYNDTNLHSDVLDAESDIITTYSGTEKSPRPTEAASELQTLKDKINSK